MGKEKKKQEPVVEEADVKLEEEVVEDKSAVYLEMAQRLQADFENYRRRATEQIVKAREDGKISVVEVFLPCLDTFKLAKRSIKDQSSLEGVEMIENKILNTLKDMGIERINSIGEKYDPNLHEAITVMRNEELENDIILEEFQAGYKYNDKVIRYAKVIVNKKED